jgi:hypothetical protein
MKECPGARCEHFTKVVVLDFRSDVCKQCIRLGLTGDHFKEKPMPKVCPKAKCNNWSPHEVCTFSLYAKDKDLCSLDVLARINRYEPK